MSIPIVSGYSVAQQSLQSDSVKLQAAIADIVSGNASSASDNVADVSTASQLQSQTSALKQVSGNIVQTHSLTQVAAGGVQQLQGLFNQIQEVAQQAQSPIVNPADAQALNNQYQQLSQQIDTIVSTTTFNGKKLLDGSLSGNNALSLDALLSSDGNSSGSSDLSVASLSSASLLPQGLNLTSPGNAAQVAAAAVGALEQLNAVQTNIGSFQQTLDFASANIDSAIANQTAAQSSLSETDFAQASTQLSLDNLKQNADILLVAQGNRLAPSMLQLLT